MAISTRVFIIRAGGGNRTRASILEGSRATTTPHPRRHSLFVSSFAVTVRTNDIAFAHLFEQFFRIDTTEHSRHLKRFINWNAMVEVHREKGKALQAIGARHIAQLAKQRGLVAAQPTLSNRHVARFDS